VVSFHGLASDMSPKRRTDFDIFRKLPSGLSNNLVAGASLLPISTGVSQSTPLDIDLPAHGMYAGLYLKGE
jgi:hypothetical protein